LKSRPSWWPGPGQVWQSLKQRQQIALPVAGIIVVILLVAFWLWFWPWYSLKETDNNRATHHPNAHILNPIGAAIGGAVLVWAAFRQARIASERHKEQTDADRQRRLTESYTKAVEQLAHADMAVRLGGIYSLGQISQESPRRYWTVMETLTAFVRERAGWKEPDAEVMESVARFSTVLRNRARNGSGSRRPISPRCLQ
jgi:flagellar biosynthesis/type III secretory pathway M-ring protein FliF/YscJ